jgi:ElaB/YqjD/DUF883 family membrane-anchored ribosome-binding protein
MESGTSHNVDNPGCAAAATLADDVDALRRNAAPVLTEVAARAQTIGRQGMDAISDVIKLARNGASQTSDSIIDYTKENPVKALMIAAASGALLLILIKALTPSRD